jgi:hypothetical protein
VAYAGRDLIVSAHQHITKEWWNKAQERFKLYISEAILEEISAGDPLAAVRRQEIVQGLPILELNNSVRKLVRNYEKNLGLPSKAKADLLHIGFAVEYEMDYLLTWNCSHIANGEVFWFSVNWTFSRFEINYLKRRKVHENDQKEASQLHSRREGYYPETSFIGRNSGLQPLRGI